MWYRAASKKFPVCGKRSKKNFFPNDKVVNTGLGWGYIVAWSRWAGWRAATTLCFPNAPASDTQRGCCWVGCGKKLRDGERQSAPISELFWGGRPNIFLGPKKRLATKEGLSISHVCTMRKRRSHAPRLRRPRKKKESRWLLSFFGGETHVSERAFAYTHPAMLHNGEGGRRSIISLFPIHTPEKAAARRGKGGGKQSRNYHGCLSRAASFGKERTSADFPASSEGNT